MVLTVYFHWFVYFLKGVVELPLATVGEDAFKGQSNQKPVWDFIRVLLMDSLLNVSGNGNTHPLILMLEVKIHTPIKSQIHMHIVAKIIL